MWCTLLLQGLVPAGIRLIPHTVLTFIFLEQLKKYFGIRIISWVLWRAALHPPPPNNTAPPNSPSSLYSLWEKKGKAVCSLFHFMFFFFFFFFLLYVYLTHHLLERTNDFLFRLGLWNMRRKKVLNMKVLQMGLLESPAGFRATIKKWAQADVQCSCPASVQVGLVRRINLN